MGDDHLSAGQNLLHSAETVRKPLAVFTTCTVLNLMGSLDMLPLP